MATVFDQIQKESFGSTCHYRYKTADFVGRGRFGNVYEANVRDRYSLFGGRLMVVKVFHLSADKKPLISLETWTTWRSRMKTLLDLAHKNVVMYHKVTILKARGTACVELLMEYCRGGDLAAFLHRLAGKKILLDERTAFRYAVDVAEGLNYLHQNNIIHGDLKPGNVLVKQVTNGEDSLVICDLDDFVQMQGNQTCTDDISHLRGTYRYMSPEMLRTFGDPPTEERPGRKTDVWSLGCIILALAERVVDINERWLQKGQITIPAGENISDNAYMIKVIDGFIPVCHDSLPQELGLCIQRCLCERSAERCTALEIVNELKVTSTVTASAVSTEKALSSTTAEATSASFRIMMQVFGKLMRNAGEESRVPSELASGVVITATFGSSCRYKFRPEDYLVRGTFGIVYAGKIKRRGDYRGKSRVAIKEVHVAMSDASFDLEGWKQHCRWWKQLCGLRHNHLLAYHKITVAEVRTGVSVELVMDYYDGGDLASMLKGLKESSTLLDETEALNFATQTTDGLDFLHRNSIIHANLKPNNILRKRMENGQKRLAIGSLDNVVKMQQPDTCSRDMTQLHGSLRYISPEMLRKFSTGCEEEIGRKTDMWSLGCIILELANSVVGSDEMWLRKGETFIEVGNQMSDHRFIMYILDGFVPVVKLPDSAPFTLRSSILRCLNPTSSERISAAGLLQKLHSFAPISLHSS